MHKQPMDVPAITLSILGAITLILVISFVFMSVNGKDYSNVYLEKKAAGEITNPSMRFSLAQNDTGSGERVIHVETEDGIKTIIIKDINIGNISTEEIEKELVNYASIVLKLYNLHNIPFTSITPKIQIYVEKNPYLVEITKGVIIIDSKAINNPDIIIRTTYEEVFKIIENEDYAGESVSLGKTTVEAVADKFTLFAKGYLTLLDEIDNFFTGFAIK